MQSFKWYLPKITIGLSGIALIVLAVIVLMPSPSPAQPVISWVPESLNETVLAGESKTVSVSFTASQDLGAVEVRVVPELAPFVRIEPTSFPSLTTGQPVDLNVIISAPEDALPQIVDGTIQIRNAGRPPRNFAQPLPVAVSIEWKLFSDDQLGLSVKYPPNWIIRREAIATTFSNVAKPSELSENALQTESFFEVRVLSDKNPNELPINQWFDQFFSGGFSAVPDTRDSLIINGHDAVRIEISEVGQRVHIYVAKKTDVIEIAYGLFAPHFVDEYEIILNSFTFTE